MKVAQLGNDPAAIRLASRADMRMRANDTTSVALPPSLHGVTSRPGAPRQLWEYPREIEAATQRSLLLRRVLMGGCAGAALLFAWNTMAWLGQLGRLPWLTALGVYGRALRAYLPLRPDA